MAVEGCAEGATVAQGEIRRRIEKAGRLSWDVDNLVQGHCEKRKRSMVGCRD